MKTLTMLEFRGAAESVIKQVQRGQSFVLTYRGKPVARLEPIREKEIRDDDPIYQLAKLATDTGESLTNEEMDRIIYDT